MLRRRRRGDNPISGDGVLAKIERRCGFGSGMRRVAEIQRAASPAAP